MTSTILLRIIRRWYQPDLADARSKRTEEAHLRAIAVRVRAERVDARLQRTRASYERASQRMNHNGGRA